MLYRSYPEGVSNLVPVGGDEPLEGMPGNEERGKGVVAHGRVELLLHWAGEVLAREADRRVLALSQVILGVAGDPVEHAHPAGSEIINS